MKTQEMDVAGETSRVQQLAQDRASVIGRLA